MRRWRAAFLRPHPSHPRLSAAEEAGVYQRYTQLCCPSVSAAQGDLAPKQPRPGDRSPSAVLPADPQLPGAGRGTRRGGGERETASALRLLLHARRGHWAVLGAGPKEEGHHCSP